MGKRIFLGLFIYCLIFINYKIPGVFAQEKEWERVRVSAPAAEKTPPAEKVAPKVEYFIAPDDVIEVYVWQNEDLNRTIKVAPDGTISYPLVGRIQAAGLTLGQLEEKMAEALSKYIKYPQVSIMLQQTAGHKLIILGEVNSVGIHTYLTPTINLIEAIALAGDFKENARSDCVMIVRGNLTEHPEVKRINLVRMIREGTSNPEIILRPNDVIYVPRSFISNFNKFLNNIGPTIDFAMKILDVRGRIMEVSGHSDNN